MSRLKLFLLVLILAALSIVFIQNQELISLKLLCADRTQSCFYRTPRLPLAVWIALFVLAGMLINLLGQVLNRYSYSGSSKRKYANDLYPDDRWTQNREYSTATEINDSKRNSYDSTSYEVRQEPENVEQSGSTYSYKYREASDRPNESKDTKKTTFEAEIDSKLNKDKDDEDWI